MSSKENGDYLMQMAIKAGIRDPKELANFMAQMQVESGRFVSMDENLNYSGHRLLEMFPGRNGLKTIEQANAIAAGGKEGIADAIYGGEWGEKKLGNTEKGDGFRFHGRGYVQLTGRTNYETTGKALGLDLVNHPELAADRTIAARIAIHYWETRVVPHNHQRDVTGACRDINKGTNGLPARMAAAADWENKLTRGHQPGTSTTALRQHEGAHDDAIRELQAQLNAQGYSGANGSQLKVDGHFGINTLHAVKAFQNDHGLKPTGTAGLETLSKLQNLSLERWQTTPPTSSQRAAQLNDPKHTDHTLFKQALDAIHRLDSTHGRTPDQRSERLAAALVVAARTQGMHRVDHAELSTDASKVFLVQGALNSPFKQIASVPTVESLNTSVAQSTQALGQVMLQKASEQQSQQHDQHPTQAQARRDTGPTMAM